MLQNLLKSALLLSIISMFGKLLGMMRDQIVAYYFGTTAGADAYFFALALQGVVTGLSSGALILCLIPYYSKQSRDHYVTSYETTSTLIAATSLLSLLFMGILLFVYTHLSSLLGVEQKNVSASLWILLLLMPSSLFLSIVNLFRSIHESQKRFVPGALAPLLMNVVTIIGFLISPVKSVGVLATLTLIGSFLSMVYLIYTAFLTKSYRVRKINFRDQNFREITVLSIPIFFTGLFNQLYVIFSRSFSLSLQSGGVSALSYSDKLIQLPNEICILAIATVFYPMISSVAAKKEIHEVRKLTTQVVGIIVLISLPITTAFVLYGNNMIEILFHRGQFTASSVVLTSNALRYYAFGFTALALNQVVAKTYYALKNTKTPVKISIVTSVVNIILAYLLMGSQNYLAIPISWSISMILQSILLLIGLHRNYNVTFSFKINRTFLLSSLVMLGFILGASLLSNSTGNAWVEISKISTLFVFYCLSFMLIFRKQIRVSKFLKRRKGKAIHESL